MLINSPSYLSMILLSWDICYPIFHQSFQAQQYYTLADWRKARKYAKKHTVVLTEDEANAKICELERENAELRQANEILKDALGFFAKDRKR